MNINWNNARINAWKHIKNYIHKNPAVAYGWVTVITTYIVRRYPDLPSELVMLTILSLFGLSKTVQKVENKKTEEALHQMIKDYDGKASRQSSR